MLLGLEKSMNYYYLLLLLSPYYDFFKAKITSKMLEIGLIWRNEKGNLNTINLAVCLAFPPPRLPHV